MSKRNSDGDVLANRVSLALAKSQRRLASMLGPQPESHATATTAVPDEIDEDLRGEFADPEQLGVGGIRPKDLEDGNFTRRGLTSDDKLLAQLIGKKKAKVHIASKLQAARLGAQQQPKHGRSTATKKEESEDEEEGRAARFKSKRKKTAKFKPTSDEDDEEPALPVQASKEGERDDQKEQDAAVVPATGDPEEEDRPTAKPKSMPSRAKAKPKSYLDELLAERSKKKKKKDAK